jgi:hypothetical protein
MKKLPFKKGDRVAWTEERTCAGTITRVYKHTVVIHGEETEVVNILWDDEDRVSMTWFTRYLIHTTKKRVK